MGFGTHVKPVLRASGHGNPIARFTEQLQHCITDVQAEKATPLHEKAHLVFAVGVLGQKLLAQGLAVWMIWREANRIHRGVRPTGLHSGDFGGVSRQDRGRIGIRGQDALNLPALKAHAQWRQGGGDCGRITAAELWGG